MKKILLSIILFTFLISSVFAVSFDAQYSGSGDNSKTIIVGQSVSVRVFGSSMHPPVSINVKLNSKVIYSETFSKNFEKVYSITPSAAGTYTIEVTAQDGVETKTKTLSLIANPATTPANNAPVLASIENKVVNETESLQFIVSATDADGDALIFAASGIPSGASFNPNTKTFSWTPSSSQIGSYFITFQVSDGKATDSETITITVNDLSTSNDTIPPTITLIGSPIITIELGTIYVDAGATATDNLDGTITPQIILNNLNTNTIGTYSIVYRATDSSGNFADATRTIYVVNSTSQDTDAPSVEITSPRSKTYYYSGSKKTFDFEFEISDDAETCWYDLNNETFNIACSSNDVNDVNVKTGENNLTVYARDSAGNIGYDTVIFNYKKKSSGSGSSGGGITVSTIKDEVIPTQNIVIPAIKSEKKENYNLLYAFLIATTSLGIIIVSIILYRKIKEIKEKEEENKKQKNYTPNLDQTSPSSPYY